MSNFDDLRRPRDVRLVSRFGQEVLILTSDFNDVNAGTLAMFDDYESVTTCGFPTDPDRPIITKATLLDRTMRLDADVYVRRHGGWDADVSLYLRDEGVGMHACFRTEVSRTSYTLRR